MKVTIRTMEQQQDTFNKKNKNRKAQKQLNITMNVMDSLIE